MPNFSQFTAIGHVTRDPEKRQTKNSQVAGFGIAVNRTRDKDAPALFIDCGVWGGGADVICQYVSKGDPIMVTGELFRDVWTDKKSGEERERIKLDVRDFTLLGKSGGGEKSAKPAASHGAPTGQYQPVTDDEIPF